MSDLVASSIAAAILAELRPAIRAEFRAALAAQEPARSAERPRTINEAAARARCKPARVRLAIATGALPANEAPDAKGRTPRFLVDHTDLDTWLRAGKPTEPPP